MKGIGGNISATIQIRTTTKNEIGEQVETWVTKQTIKKGWLDLMTNGSQENSLLTYSAKIQESTHVFICDYEPLDESITSENSRMIINGKRYSIQLIDNPMEMKYGSQLEFYLKYTGGQ